MSIDLKFTEFKGASCVAKFSPQPSALSKVIFKLLCVFLFIFFANSSISATKNCTYKYRFSYHTGGGNFSWTNYYNSLAEACSTKFPSGYIGWVEDIPRPSAGGQFCIYYSDVRGWGWAPLNTSEELYTCDTTSTLTLSPAPNQKDPRPLKAEGKDGKSTYELIARVMEGSTPKAGVTVTFGVEPIANSGGHDHHNASRPEGELLQSDDVTDANGEIKLRFEAPEFAGTHVVAAFCSSCTNTSVTKNIDVKVPDLVALTADSSVPPRYELAGNTSAVGVKHKGNHYFTASAKAYLLRLIDHYNSFAWQPVAVNDASIIWGGWFDIYSNWAGSHAEHRIGEEVDLGFLVGTNASKIKRGYDEVCKDKKVEIPSTILWHDIPKPAGKYDPHFHVRLSGSYTKDPSAGKYAPCKSDSGTK